MWIRMPERTRKIIFYAQEEAIRRDMKGVSSEHLLLGLLRDIKEQNAVWPPAPTSQIASENFAEAILREANVDFEQLCDEAEKQKMAANIPVVKNVSLTISAKRTIDVMYEEARRVSCDNLTTEFLLLALIRDDKGSAGQSLRRCGVHLEAAQQQVDAIYVRSEAVKMPKPAFWSRWIGGKTDYE